MSTDPEELETPEDEVPEGEDNDNIKALREAAKRGQKATAKAAQLERENAFLKAGVSTESELGKLMLIGYDGDLTTQAIQSWAEKVQPGRTPPPIPPDEQQFSQTRSDIAGGTPDQGGGEPQGDWVKEGYEQFHQQMKDGDSREKAAAAVFDRIIDKAAKGDPRALVDPEHGVTSTAKGKA